MGEPMARHLHQAGLLRAVHNRTAAKAEALATELGVAAIHDATELARECDVIVTSVTADADVIGLADASPDVLTDEALTGLGALMQRALEGGDFTDAVVARLAGT